jgi:predicted acylesterase/phospholipase RssA/CRP-like cAMP-binding protein
MSVMSREATRLSFSDRSILGRLGQSFHNRLSGIATTRKLRRGEVLCEAGDLFDGAHLVVEGRFRAKSPAGGGLEMGPGEVVDELQLLTGGRCSETWEAIEPTRVLRFPPDRFRTLVSADESVLEQLSSLASERLQHRQLSQILQKLFGPLDDVLRQHIIQQIVWMELKPGEVLFSQSDPGDALYALLDGRMAAFNEGPDGPLFLNEILPGETIGEIAMVTGDDRSATVKAVKHSLLIRLEKSDFDAIAEQHPIVYKAFAKVLVTWLQRSHDTGAVAREAKEIALLAHRPAPRLMEQVANQMAEALSVLGATLRLNSSYLREMGGRYLFDVGTVLNEPIFHPRNTRFRLWLDEQKRQHDFILYESDGDGSMWDRLCIDRAHEAVIVADADADPAPGEPERMLRDAEMTALRLALIHPEGAIPTETGRWLGNRKLVGHHHLHAHHAADFQRLARFIAGQAIGLVLAGGGARGFAHIGIIRALSEMGIPIDIIGGTSSGGMVALTYAMEPSPDALESHNRREWVDRKPLQRFAIPVLSILDHTKWDQIFFDAFRWRTIEDLWIPAFSVSCNLDTGQTIAHDEGLAWKAVRATASLPVFLAPVLLDGHGHVDGGVVNNMPTDIMRQRTSGPVFTVSLGHDAPQKLSLESYPSPWKLALQRLPGFRSHVHHHTVPKVILRLSTMQDQAAFDARAQLADFVFLPPVGKFSMTDIASVDEITAIGHGYGLERLRAWAREKAFMKRLGAAGIEPGGQFER